MYVGAILNVIETGSVSFCPDVELDYCINVKAISPRRIKRSWGSEYFFGTLPPYPPMLAGNCLVTFGAMLNKFKAAIGTSETTT